MRPWLAALAVLAGALGAHGKGQAQPLAAPKVQVELAPESAAAVPGGVIHIALRQRITPGWHTYWRNPGDSGEATRIAWTLPPGWSAGPIVWPTPEREAIGPLVNYGYTGEVYLPVPVAVPASARPGERVTLRADASWLVCEQVCIPEAASLELRLPVAAALPDPHPRFGRALAATLAEAPKPSGLSAVTQRQGRTLKLAVTGPGLADADLVGAYFFPFEGDVIDHAAPQSIERGPQGLTFSLTPAPNAAPSAASVGGVLALKQGAFEIEAAPGVLPAGAGGLGPPRPGGEQLTLAPAIALAFLGGLLLNLMPCVFPVLSMKAASLAGHAHRPRAARWEGLAFLAGVLGTFLALAGVLIAARAAGEAVGWGFQLQSPAVTATLALLMLAVGLNLSGVYHMGLSIQGVGSGREDRSGALGALLTGALAVVVAAPCTAPFMAGAVGFALTQPPASALAVFAALGLGFAAPFTLLSLSPGLLRRLPQPGPWMGRLKQVLALPMYAAAAWLAWVLLRQAGERGLLLLVGGAVLVGAAAWLWGRSQARAGRLWPLRTAAGAAVVAALVAVGAAAGLEPASRPTAVVRLGGEAYAPARLAALRAEGRPVFVNFTADWCVSCKVNEQVALSSRRVEEAFRRTGTVYLKGDWTARDAEIAAALAEHRRSGVPLYLVYGSGGREAVILPQLLTEGAVVKALEEAARAPS